MISICNLAVALWSKRLYVGFLVWKNTSPKSNGSLDWWAGTRDHWLASQSTYPVLLEGGSFLTLDCCKEKKAALVIERFFMMMKHEIESEIIRRETSKQDKRRRRHREKREDDDKLLERAWLNTDDSAPYIFTKAYIEVTSISKRTFANQKTVYLHNERSRTSISCWKLWRERPTRFLVPRLGRKHHRHWLRRNEAIIIPRVFPLVIGPHRLLNT